MALDWIANTVHTPLLVAQSKGFYKEVGLNVSFLGPYDVSPARQVLSGKAHLAVCPSESIVAFAETAVQRESHDRLQAVFALLDQNASSILCSASSGIKRPRDLDGRMYGSYNARYEDDIIRDMIRRDGGAGDVKIESKTAKLELFDSLSSAAAASQKNASAIDATWIFTPWEGVKAASAEGHTKGVELRLEDYGIPYGYSPVLARAADTHMFSDKQLGSFLTATAKGYEFALEHHEKTVTILSQYCQGETTDFLSKSLHEIKRYWKTNDFGVMEKARWESFIAYLRETSLLNVDLQSEDLYVNL